MKDMPEHLPELPSGYVYAGLGKDLAEHHNDGRALADGYDGSRWFATGLFGHWATNNHYAVPADSDLGRKILAERGKPDWSEAPSWAEWLAQDEDGDWQWFSKKPFIHAPSESWDIPDFATEVEIVSAAQPNPEGWRTTLERRPESTKVGKLHVEIDASEARRTLDEALGELPDLIIPHEVCDDHVTLAAIMMLAREEGYSLEWDSRGLRGYRK